MGTRMGKLYIPLYLKVQINMYLAFKVDCISYLFWLDKINRKMYTVKK